MDKIASRFGFACVVLWIAVAGCSSEETPGGGAGTATGSGTTGSTSSSTSSSSDGTGGGDVCAQSCVKLEAASCAGDTPGDCATFCQSPVCVMQRTDLATCILGATVSCDPDTTKAMASACAAQGAAHRMCLENQ